MVKISVLHRNFITLFRVLSVNMSFCVSIDTDTTTDKNKDEVNKLTILRARLKTDIPVKELESLSDASSISKQVEIILDQIKHLRSAVSTTIDKAKNKSRKSVNGINHLFTIL